MEIYLDQAATTPVSPKALEAMLPCYTQFYGNPSSLHTPGQLAKEQLEAARQKVAKCLNAQRTREIIFTAGGSEADNQALLTGAALGKKQGKTHIITSAFEHHAVLHTLEYLEGEGFTVTKLPVYENGVVRPADLEAAITDQTALVSVMLANNEIGTIQPIAELSEICHAHGALMHTDAVQAVGHIPVDVQALGVDLLSLSGHKFHGPRGVGALYARTGVRVSTFVHGGAQEFGKRAGTENLPAIVGMAAALEEACTDLETKMAQTAKMRDYLADGLAQIPASLRNGDWDNHLPGCVNFCFKGVEGESLLLLLDAKGIAASSGSACTSGSLDPSHVLLAIGLPHAIAHGSLRLSFDEKFTTEQADYVIQTVSQTVSYLRDISPLWEQMERGEA